MIGIVFAFVVFLMLSDLLAMVFYGFLCLCGYLIRFLAICVWQALLAACRGVWFCTFKAGEGLALLFSFLFILIDEWRRSAPQEDPVQEPRPEQPKPEWNEEFFKNFNLNDPPPKESPKEEPPRQEKPLPPPDPYILALGALGLPANFTQVELSRAYKIAIRKAHPDLGGSHEKAQAVNTARDLLARHHGWR